MLTKQAAVIQHALSLGLSNSKALDWAEDYLKGDAGQAGAPAVDTPPKPKQFNEDERRRELAEQAAAIERARSLGLPISAARQFLKSGAVQTNERQAGAPVGDTSPQAAAARREMPSDEELRKEKKIGALFGRLMREQTRKRGVVEVVNPVKVHGELAAAVLNKKHARGFAVWLLGRLMDKTGAGVVLLSELKRFANEGGGLRGDAWQAALKQAVEVGLISKRRRRDGKMVVELRSLLNVGRLYGLQAVGHPVNVPAHVMGAPDKLKSALWSAWHTGRAGAGGPISRDVCGAVGGIAGSTMREYEKREGVKVENNFSETGTVGTQTNCAKVAAGLRDQGKAAFVIRRGGRRRAVFQVVVRLPNSYTTRQAEARRGNSRKVSRTLRGELVNKSSRLTRAERVFCETEEQAARVDKHKQQAVSSDVPDTFYKRRKVKASGPQWWSFFSVR